jgi:Ran GTPase-activating protein (RanGAP) involved in mRNA processing and transport
VHAHASASKPKPCTYAQALFKAVATHASLSTLDLGCLSDTGRNVAGREGSLAAANMLESTTTLTHLCLAANRLSPEEGAALAQGLRANSSVQVLDLSDNHLADAGTGALAEAATCAVGLRHLNLGSNQMEERGARSIVSLLNAEKAVLEELHLDGNTLTDTAAAMVGHAVCERNSVLTSLALDNCRCETAPATPRSLEVFYPCCVAFVGLRAISHIRAHLSLQRASTLSENRAPLRRQKHTCVDKQ